jgi:hypothetical protein
MKMPMKRINPNALGFKKQNSMDGFEIPFIGIPSMSISVFFPEF